MAGFGLCPWIPQGRDPLVLPLPCWAALPWSPTPPPPHSSPCVHTEIVALAPQVQADISPLVPAGHSLPPHLHSSLLSQPLAAPVGTWRALRQQEGAKNQGREVLALPTGRMQPAEDGTVSPRPRSPLQLGCAPGLVLREGQEGEVSTEGAAEGEAALQRQPEAGLAARLRTVPTAPRGRGRRSSKVAPRAQREPPRQKFSFISPAPGPGYKLAQLI